MITSETKAAGEGHSQNIGVTSRQAAIHAKRLSALLNPDIVRQVCEAEAALEQRKRAEKASTENWYAIHNARLEENRRIRASLWKRWTRTELQASEKESKLLAEALAMQMESEKAGRALWRLIADYLSERDATFEVGRDMLSSMRQLGSAKQRRPAGPVLYAQSIHDQIQVFRELCRQASLSGRP